MNRNDSFVPALHEACMHDYFAIAEVLLERGADVHLVGEGTGTPLQFAADAGASQVIPNLMRRGADPLAVNDSEERSAFQIALERGKVEAFCAMVNEGGGLLFGEEPLTPFTVAWFIYEDAPMACRLIEQGVIVDMDVESLLGDFIYREEGMPVPTLEMIRALMSRGDFTIENLEGLGVTEEEMARVQEIRGLFHQPKSLIEITLGVVKEEGLAEERDQRLANEIADRFS